MIFMDNWNTGLYQIMYCLLLTALEGLIIFISSLSGLTNGCLHIWIITLLNFHSIMDNISRIAEH